MIKTIDTLKNKNVLIVSSNATTPHLETAIEIFERLAKNNNVDFLHIGSFLSRPTLFPTNIIKRKLQLKARVKKAELYIKNINEEYNWIEVNLNKIEIENQINDILKNDNFAKVDSLEKLQSLNFKGHNIGLGISSTIISYLRNPNPFPLNLFEQIELKEQIKTSITSILISEKMISDKYNSIILFNGRFSSEHAIKQVAIEKKLKVYYHECGAPYPLGRYFFEDYMPHNFDKRKEEMRNIQENLSKEFIHQIGTDFFNKKTNGEGVYEKSYVKNQKLNYSASLNKIFEQCKYDKRKIICFFSSSDDEYELIDGHLNRFQSWIDQKSAIKEIASLCNLLGYYFIVRIHPNLKNKARKEQKSWDNVGNEIKKYGFTWISQKQLEPTYKIIKHSDLIISAGSTVGIEAIFLDKPSIAIAKCKYDGLFTGVKLCESSSDMRELLTKPTTFKSPNRKNCLIYGAWAMLYGNRFQFFSHEAYEDGHMKNGIKIASAGRLQKNLSKIKSLLNTSLLNKN